MSTSASPTVAPVRCIWPLAATLGEGALWSMREQSLYFVDILGRRLHRFRPADGASQSWEFEEEISALCERRDAPGLLVSLRHGLALFDPADGCLQRLCKPEAERPDNRFNDGKCDAAGRWWIGSTDFACTQPTGALYCYEGNGRCRRMRDGVHISNGPTWSADGRHLYFNETGHLRTWRHAFDMDSGELGPARLWLQHDPADGAPDGMTTDATGNVWIARWGGSAVTCHGPDGHELARIVLPTAHITSVCFGGPDLRTLFITSARQDLDAAQLEAQPLAGALFAVTLDVAGVPAHRFAG